MSIRIKPIVVLSGLAALWVVGSTAQGAGHDPNPLACDTGKVMVCHGAPPEGSKGKGKGRPGKTLEVCADDSNGDGVDDFQQHLNHGDTLGACSS